MNDVAFSVWKAMGKEPKVIVYANLTGDDIDLQAKNIVQSMNAAGVERLIFVASLGIYDEVPGKFGAWNRRQMRLCIL